MKRSILMIAALLLTVPSVGAAEQGNFLTKAKNLTLGAEVRTRYENRYNHNFNKSTPNSSDFTLLRTRLNVGMDVVENVRAFIQIQDSRVFGATRDESRNAQNLDLRQGYVDLMQFGGLPVDLRIGRQTLVYGDQRLIGAFEWNNVGRAFDGAKAVFRPADDLQVDLFATKIAELDRVVAEGESIDPISDPVIGGANVTAGGDEDQNFYGVYAMWKPGKQNVDFYLLYLEDNSPELVNARGVGAGTSLQQNATDDNLELWTGGVRLKGPIAFLAGFDYGFEGAYQFGSGADLDIRAYALHGEIGYALPLFVKSHLSVEANYATGDDDPADDDFETFSNLFPTNHLHYGYMDRISWSNAQNYALKLDSVLTEKLKAGLHLWHFELAESEDRLYHAGGATIPGIGGAGGKREIGQEVDLIFNYKYNQAVAFHGGYSHFFVRDAVEEGIADADDADYFYLQMAMNF